MSDWSLMGLYWHVVMNWCSVDQKNELQLKKSLNLYHLESIIVASGALKIIIVIQIFQKEIKYGNLWLDIVMLYGNLLL